MSHSSKIGSIVLLVLIIINCKKEPVDNNNKVAGTIVK